MIPAFSAPPAIATAHEAKIGAAIAAMAKADGHRPGLPVNQPIGARCDLTNAQTLHWLRGNPSCTVAMAAVGLGVTEGVIRNRIAALRGQGVKIHCKTTRAKGERAVTRYTVPE